MAYVLEDDTRHELHQARRPNVRQSTHWRPEGCDWIRTVTVDSVQCVKVQVIGSVVRLGPQNQIGPFGHMDRLLQGEVKVVRCRSLSRIAANDDAVDDRAVRSVAVAVVVDAGCDVKRKARCGFHPSRQHEAPGQTVGRANRSAIGLVELTGRLLASYQA